MKVVKKLLLLTTWLLLIYTTFELGMWQLHRAQDMSVATAPKADQPVIDLDQVSAAGKNLPTAAVNRIVSTSGIYTSSYIARDQKVEEGKISNLDVRLLKLKSGYSVLVVREIAKLEPVVINTPVEIVGRQYPRQNVDRAFAKPGELSRIDPSLVVSKENPFLYDGYIILQSESFLNMRKNNISPIPSPAISQEIPGFYWQHISYVVVWWFMGLLLLVAPLFPQFRAPKKVENVGKSR